MSSQEMPKGGSSGPNTAVSRKARGSDRRAARRRKIALVRLGGEPEASAAPVATREERREAPPVFMASAKKTKIGVGAPPHIAPSKVETEPPPPPEAAPPSIPVDVVNQVDDFDAKHTTLMKRVVKPAPLPAPSPERRVILSADVDERAKATVLVARRTQPTLVSAVAKPKRSKLVLSLVALAATAVMIALAIAAR